MEDKPKIYSVSLLTGELKRLIEGSALRAVYVEGEISGWRVYPSGHAYFALKDEGAVLNAVMFAGALANCAQGVRDRLVNGAKVRMWGQIDVYPPRGSYQLVVRRAWVSGAGDLAAKFEALKRKLAAEGLFDASRKKPLPFLPHRIGIVTSPAGAVIHDMATVLLRRFPNIEIRLFPVKVQGDGAAEDVVRGIRWFQPEAAKERGDAWIPDLLIVGRGGGSVEDLWAFNEEILVRAVAASAVPVVSAVGHETDVTLCDFAADLRAGTPSIAAERAVPVKAELAAQVAGLADRLVRAPQRMGEMFAQRVDFASARLVSALKSAAQSREARLGRVAPRLLPAVRAALSDAGHRLERSRERLKLLNPYSVLDRGYSITTDSSGRVVRSASALKDGDLISTRVGDGVARSVVRASS